MGFLSKRKTKKVPDLVEGLKFLRTSLATLGASGNLDAGQMRGLEEVSPIVEGLIDQGDAYLAEYRADGDVSDPDLGDWIDHAHATLAVGLDSVNKARKKMIAEGKPWGGS
jgi:hypothetical protein